MNPPTPSEWRKKAKSLSLDPAQLDLTTYKPHSASKFSETDFIHLKALWKNKDVGQFHIRDYVQEKYADQWDSLIAKASSPEGQLEAFTSPIQWLAQFIQTSEEALTADDAKNMRLGAFMTVKSHLDKTKGINGEGKLVAGDSPKIRRSARVLELQRKREASTLTQQMGSLMLGQKFSGRPITPPNKSAPVMVRTHELDVISPESMALEKDRSRDEDSVNMALVLLLDTTTICSGILKMHGRDGLSWLATRQSFHLGPASCPVCEARTDGKLTMEERGSPSLTLAILEVKPYLRRPNQAKIEWQEACQMAAWISTTLGEKTARKRREGILRKGEPNKRRYVELRPRLLQKPTWRLGAY